MVKSQFPLAFDDEWFILGVLVEMMEYSRACVSVKKTSMTYKCCLNKPSMYAHERLLALKISPLLFFPSLYCFHFNHAWLIQNKALFTFPALPAWHSQIIPSYCITSREGLLCHCWLCTLIQMNLGPIQFLAGRLIKHSSSRLLRLIKEETEIFLKLMPSL